MAHNQFGYIQQCSKPLIYVNEHKYLLPSLVKKCFVPSKFTFVDKGKCGNGFSSCVMDLMPSAPKKNTIIIMPNRQVILDKQKDHSEKSHLRKNRIGFIYGESENGLYHSDKVDFDKYDVLLFVADSFINNIDLIKSHSHKIERILIDEAHSTLIQSVYREKLKGFIPLVKSSFPAAAIVAVTATPLLSQRADIVIKNTLIEQRVINISENQKECFLRAKALIDAGENVIVATNSAAIASRFKINGVLNANFKIGKTFRGSLVELCEVIQNDDSNLTILSSSGFEGFDIKNKKNHVFIFEDRSNDFETYFPANIIQIIGRSREGTNSIWWCRNTHSKGRTDYTINKVLNQLLSRKIPIEKKVSAKNYALLQKFTSPSKSKLLKEGQFLLEFDKTKWQLYKETVLSDNCGFAKHNDFFKSRGFILNTINEGSSRFGKLNLSDAKKEKNIEVNRGYIKANNVYVGIYCKIITDKALKTAKRHLKQYIRRKYWEHGNITENYTNNERVALDILSNESLFNSLKKEIVSNYRKYKRKKEGSATKSYTEKVAKLEENIHSILIRLVLMFVNDKVSLPKKERAWRDYSLLTETSIKVIEFVANTFYRKIIEIDITSCNPRILYAICGLMLPRGFYGLNKKNKRAINTLLNTLWYDDRVRTKSDLKKQKENKITALRYYGFDERVIKFLIDKFFDNDKSALFNFCAYHEKRIIENLRENIKTSIPPNDKIGLVRRHDSIIVMGEYQPPEDMLKDFEYLGVKGWFIAA
jgi:hypothetical protein